MKNKIKTLLFSSIALLASACTEDLPDYRGDYTLSGEGSLPIEFEFSLPDDTDTRANAPSYPKVEFEAGDVIHIMGIFQMESGQPRRTYGAYYFTENRQWEPLLSAADDGSDEDNGTDDGSGTGDGNDSGSTDPGDSTDPSDPGTTDPGDTDPSDPDDDTPETSSVPKMVWPDKCTSASFRAYYIKQLNGAMVAGSETKYILLSDLAGTGSESTERAKDPLSAGVQNVVYGHTVKLNFIHACTYLTVEELQAGVSNTFWFMCDNDRHLAFQDPVTGTDGLTVNFNNAFKLTLNDQNELNLVFGQVPDDRYLTTTGNDKTKALYVSGKTVNYIGEDGQQKSKVGFYLEPGIYNQFIIGYPMTEPAYNRYFSYTKSSSAKGTDENHNNSFRANNAYTFNVAKDSGVKMEGDGSGNEWDEDGEIIYLLPVEVEEFLYAVNKGQSYHTQDHDILQATNTGTKLLVNVDFQNYYYDQFGPDDNVTPLDNPRPIHRGEWFNPTNESEFDGNFKYIYNLGAPLFNENNGTIRDLGINTVNANNIILSRFYEREDRGATKTIDLSYRGAICCNNTKTISNIRVKNVTINALTDPEQNEEGEQEAYSLGSLVGYNQGTLEEILIYGPFNLTVGNFQGNSIVPTVNMGGLVGQNMGNGIISNINPLEGAPAVTLTNTCNGNRALYILGGISGGNVGTISDIYLPSVTVNSSASKGKWSNVGGLVGACSESTTGSLISNCIVSGSVTAGESSNEAGAVTYGYSYIGGEVGNFNSTASITGCRTVVSVNGAQTNMVHSDITYGTGGAFGRITSSLTSPVQGTIDNLVVNGTELKGPEPIGTFAGIVPAGTTWDLNALNVIVKAHNNTNGQAISEIGQTM